MKKSVWSVAATPFQDAEEVLTDRFGEPDERTDRAVVWKYRSRFCFSTHRIAYTGDGTLEVSSAPFLVGVVMFVPFVALYAFVAQIESPSFISLFRVDVLLISVSVVYFLAVGKILPSFPDRLEKIAVMQESRASPLLPLISLPVIGVTWWRLNLIHNYLLFDIFFVAFLVSFLGYCVAAGSVPLLSTSRASQALRVPFLMLMWILVAIFLSTYMLFVPGGLVVRTEIMVKIFQQLIETGEVSNLLSASIKDIFGGTEISVYTQTQRVGLQIMSFVNLLWLIWLLFHAHCWRELRQLSSLRTNELENSSTGGVRRAVLSVPYFLSNAVIIGGLVLILFVVSYGYFGFIPFSDRALVFGQPVASEPVEVNLEYRGEQFSAYRDPTPRELLNKTFFALESVNSRDQPVPGDDWAPASWRSMQVFLITLWPVTIVATGWAASIVMLPIRKLFILMWGEKIQSRFVNLEDPPQVVVTEEEDSVRLEPVSFLFGLFDYVAVSEAVDDELSQRELEAVVAHEAYHIENRNLTVEWITKVVAPVFVGQNTLLAFYDYAKVEREADDFAAETVGARHTRVAIDKLDNMTRDKGEVSLFEGENQQEGAISGLAAKLIIAVWRVLLAPCALLYGGVLNRRAHLTAKERCRRLAEDYENS